MHPPCGPVAQLGARFHGMEEVIGSIPIRSTNQPTIKDLDIVSGNPHQEIDRFHGRTLQAIYPRKTVISTTCHIRTVDAYHWAWKAFSPALVGRNCIAKSDILQRIEELRAQGLERAMIRERQLEGLRLSRASVLQQIDSARDPRHRQMLEDALAELDRRIQALQTSA